MPTRTRAWSRVGQDGDEDPDGVSEVRPESPCERTGRRSTRPRPSSERSGQAGRGKVSPPCGSRGPAGLGITPWWTAATRAGSLWPAMLRDRSWRGRRSPSRCASAPAEPSRPSWVHPRPLARAPFDSLGERCLTRAA
jgi:hypothetical protein